MKANNTLHSLPAFILTLCLALWLTPALSWGEEEDDTAELFNAWQEQVASPSRVPKPISQIAENVTVITAAEIRALNAHTLAEVLDTIPGFQLDHVGGPGVPPMVYIHSADFTNVQVLLDGVSITNLGSNFSDVTSIPAQIIDRVEIVKGASSTAWGQALGGVINIITKSPDKRLVGGSATASIGERTTADTRAELSGTSGKLGYYLSGGYLGSNGLLPGRQTFTNQAYAKLTYDLPNQGQLWGTFNYFNANMGLRYVPQMPYDLRQTQSNNNQVASLGFRSHLTDRLELELSGRHFRLDSNSTYTNISDGLAWQPVEYAKATDEVNGAGVKLIWRGDNNLLVTGSDYNHLESYQNTPDGGWTLAPYRRIADRWSAYLNDTLTVGPVSISPGVRFDHTQTSGDNLSYSFGATWQLTETLLLRGYSGLGHGIPVLLVTDSPAPKIWTSQVGAESSAIPYLWVKGTLFRNKTWHNQDGWNVDWNIPEDRVAQGAELEIRTTPVYNTSIGAGYTFTDTTRTSDGSLLPTPRHTLQVALRYDDKMYRGSLNGRYINWNSPDEFNANYGNLIWDLHLGATLIKRENTSLELFFSGHNLLNSPYYNRDIFPDVKRWFEGGVRVNF